MTRLLSLVVLGLFARFSLFAVDDLGPEARSIVLLDQSSGRILYQKDPDISIPPASLTKLMTLHLIWQALDAGTIHPSDLVPVTAETTGRSVPPDSSLMFLEPGQRVTVRELMEGLAVDSGNDAGMTLAQFLSGSQPAFVEEMNNEARRLGMVKTRFFDSFGYDARNQITAAEFAQFCRYYLTKHPQSIELLHSLRTLAYPLEENLGPTDHRPPRTIVQTNRNSLLGEYPGADGLKTGYIDESGYNLAATAVRNNQRLVAVILGIQAPNSRAGSQLRTQIATRVLDWGYSTYPLRALTIPNIPKTRAWKSAIGTFIPVPGGPTVYPLDTDEAEKVTVRVEGLRDTEGPVPTGIEVGHLVWSVDGNEIYRVSLVTPAKISEGPWWVQVWDSIQLFFSRWGTDSKPIRVVPHKGS